MNGHGGNKDGSHLPVTYENYNKVRGHPRMPNSRRARIFAPFDALNGFDEAIRARQKVSVPKVELTDYGAEELDFKLHALKEGQKISVTYYHRGKIREYLKITGILSKVDIQTKEITVVETRIPMEDIRDIEF
ncbi:MAG: YolD-like family protein [Eubacterium sp.]|nr:YolD-like family protein [Eubacterium sp.]